MILGLLALAASSGPARADDVRPDPVTSLVAAPISSEAIRLDWDEPFDDVGVVGYDVFRDGDYRATVLSPGYTDRGAGDGARHAYRVVAFDAARNRAEPSAEASAEAAAVPFSARAAVRPEPPSGLRIEAADGDAVRLAWADTEGAAGYNVYRDGRYHTTVRSTAYADGSVEPGREYRYRVVAFSDAPRYSTKSAEVSARAGDAPESAPETRSAARADVSGDGPDGYRLVFSDEFDGGSIDGSKWNTRYRWGPDWIINSERQYYVDALAGGIGGTSPFSHDGGALTISASRTPEELRGSANGQPWISGAMTTYGKFSMRYGYVEMRARFPAGQGLWPAFWLLHEGNDGSRPEIDVVEFVGKRRDRVYQTYHYYENYVLRSTPSFEVPGGDWSADFHTYGMRWEPGRITWYVDGRETNRYESGSVSSEDMYLLVNLAVGGVWNGDPDDSTPSPARYTIDWIRAYAPE